MAPGRLGGEAVQNTFAGIGFACIDPVWVKRRMPVLTIAIPTFNRIEKLKRALDAISKLVVPRDLELCVAISNSHSEDKTDLFLSQLSLPNAALFLNNKGTVHLNNWTALSKVVPVHSDFVWLHGDDDIIFDTETLLKLDSFGIFQFNTGVSITSIPQARRSRNSGLHSIANLGAYACRFGGHELLGWMSSLLLSGEAYFAYMAKYEASYNGNPDTAEIHAKGIGNLPHVTFFLEKFWSANSMLVDMPLIDEQVDPASKKEYALARRRIEFKFNYLFSDRFFFDAMNLTRLAQLHAEAQKAVFFRYTTKSLIDVLVTITIDEVGSVDMPGRIPLRDKIRIIDDALQMMGDQSKVSSLSRVVRLLNSMASEGSFDTLRLKETFDPLSYPSQVVL